jgi:hypothetical protein
MARDLAYKPQFQHKIPAPEADAAYSAGQAGAGRLAVANSSFSPIMLPALGIARLGRYETMCS